MDACAAPAVLCVLEVSRTWEANSLPPVANFSCCAGALVRSHGVDSGHLRSARSHTRGAAPGEETPVFALLQHCFLESHTPRWPHAVQLSAVLWLFQRATATATLGGAGKEQLPAPASGEDVEPFGAAGGWPEQGVSRLDDATHCVPPTYRFKLMQCMLIHVPRGANRAAFCAASQYGREADRD